MAPTSTPPACTATPAAGSRVSSKIIRNGISIERTQRDDQFARLDGLARYFQRHSGAVAAKIAWEGNNSSGSRCRSDIGRQARELEPTEGVGGPQPHRFRGGTAFVEWGEVDGG